MTSRLDLEHGPVIVTSPPDLGHIYVIIQGWTTTRGRPPTALEALQTRAPYRSDPPPAPAEHDDDLRDDAEALRACRLEQERTPVDLLTAA